MDVRNARTLDRRTFLTGAGTATAMLLGPSWFAHAFPRREGEQVLPFADQPPAPPRPDLNLSRWEDLDSWITPTPKFFRIAHYGVPTIAEDDWRLEVTGMVERPGTYTLADLRARPRADVVFTLECSGNHGFPWFISAIGNARWAGTPLAPLLQAAGLRPGAVEVVFYGQDEGEETVGNEKRRQNFARSMPLADAMSPANLLCYEMNGAPLAPAHGFPARLIVPGWYGIANVKWLRRIEVQDRRFMGHFMIRRYVTVREEERDGRTVAMETSVGRTRLKSAPARVTVKGGRHRIAGTAWGAPVARVEVAIDGGPWKPAALDPAYNAPYAWRIWTFDWADAAPGDHTITSRAIDVNGRVQPAPTDPVIARKKTYWESNGWVTRQVRLS